MPARDRPVHVSIRASAGSGKTFVLSQRFIELLARGVPVERITALTFSRKAAREIFESIVLHLCKAALSEDGARRTAGNIGMDLGRREFGRVLHGLLTNLHRLRVGTIDSFITGLLRFFPEQYGIPADFALCDSSGEEARRLHSRVLGRMLSGDGKDLRTFVSAFSAATAGRSEKRIGRVLESKLMGGQEVFRSASDCRLWGKGWETTDPARGVRHDPGGAAEALLAHWQITALAEGAQQRWRDFTRAVCAWSPGGSWSRELDYLLKKITEAKDDLGGGRAEIVVDRRAHTVDGAAADYILDLASHVVRSEIGAAAERTRGLCRLLEAYEKEYGVTVRGEGRFTFADAVAFAAGEGPAAPSIADRGEGKLYIEYRLDAKLDHWLIDEFQDTSRSQWDVFSNLADEVLQSQGGERTFFIVGDAKQAIYGWRGGDAALLDEVTEHYGERFRRRSLSRSYRSCASVIETVNMIFGAVDGRGLPPATEEAWKKIWERHTEHPGAVPPTGVAMIVEPTAEADVTPAAEDRYLLTARIVEEILAGRHDSTVGVLVRKNEQVRTVGEFLRRHSPACPVEIDGPAAILDSFAVNLVLSLVKVAFHPGHRAARAHLLMSPLAGLLQKEAAGGGGLSTSLLAHIRSDGFADFVSHWGRNIAASTALDAFERRRIDQLHTAALRFAAGGGREGDDFCAYVENLRLREASGGGKVRVMTAHQSKGLDFDAVILPDLQDWGSMDRDNPEELTVCRGEGGHVRWVLQSPRRLVAAWDRRLAAAAERRKAASALQELSLLYVATTRARSALYMVTGSPGKSSKALTPAAFIKKALCRDGAAGKARTCTLAGEVFPVLFIQGDEKWHRSDVPAASGAAMEGEQSEGAPVPAAAGDTLQRIIPSAMEESVFDAEWLFDQSSRRSLQFGDAVHALFQKVTWLDEVDLDAVVDEWRGETDLPSKAADEAERHFRRAVVAEAVRTALRSAEGCRELWREKPFDVVVGSAWLSGVFDRVELYGSPRGGVTQARVTDFKSDRIESPDGIAKAVRRYRGQMEMYREALAFLLGAPLSTVCMRLIFTGPAVVWDMMAERGEKTWTAGGKNPSGVNGKVPKG